MPFILVILPYICVPTLWLDYAGFGGMILCGISNLYAIYNVTKKKLIIASIFNLLSTIFIIIYIL